MKRFLLKSVACIIFALLVIGLFHIDFAQAATATAPCSTFDMGCHFRNIGSTVLEGLMGFIILIINYILYFIVSILGFILAGLGKILDTIIRYTMDIGSQTAILDSVRLAWVMLRDTFNVFFIFVLLYVAITTILQVTKIETKKMLMSVIISAILINFSMFFTKIIIDTSNIVAVALYNQTISTSDAENNVSISGKLMNGLQLQSFGTLPKENTTDPNSPSVISGKSTGLALLQIVQIILISLTIWAFLQAVILLAVRTIAFFILMALSPLGFIGNVLPKMKKYSDEWWDTLTGQCLVAPVFLFFVFLLTKIVGPGGLTQNLTEAISAWTNPATATVATDSANGVFGGMMNVVIIMGFMIIAVKVTKNFSGKLGSSITGIGSSALGLAAGIATGGVALAGRGVIGRMAANVASREGLKEAAATKGGMGGFAARMTLKAADATSKSSFDARNTPVSGLVKKTGVDMGKAGGKGGFATTQTAYTKEQTEYAKKLNRDDLTDEQAMKEHEDIKSKQVDKVGNLEGQILEQKLINEDETKSQRERNGAKEKVEKLTKLSIKEKGGLDKRIAMEVKDKRGNLTKEAKDAIIKERKAAYQEAYAKTLENNIGSKLTSWLSNTVVGPVPIGGLQSVVGPIPVGKIINPRNANKAAADKIRKELVKGKSKDKQIADLVKKAYEEEGENKIEKIEEKKLEEKPSGEKPTEDKKV